MSLSGATNKLGDKIFKILNEGENVIFSSIGVLTTLAMLSLGAKGQTYNEIMDGTHLKNTDFEKIKKMIQRINKSNDLKLINSTFTENMNEVDEKYLNSLKSLFHAKIYNMDLKDTDKFASTMNNIIASETDGKITNLIDKDDVKQWKFMVLLNILTFSGKWTKKFDVIKEIFTNSKGEKNHIDMIKSKSDFYIFENNVCKIIEVPYQDSDVVMQILLPNNGWTFDQIIDVFNDSTEDLGKIFQKNRKLERNVQLTLPKFHLCQTHDLVPVLMKMGVSEMFKDSADFTAISEGPLYVGKTSQNVNLTVDENGTEVASATKAEIYRCGPSFFTVDKPFMFYLRDRKTGLLLIQGKVNNLQ